MATLGYTSFEEARLEEEEFYHFALNSSLEEESKSEEVESIEDFLSDRQSDVRRERKYPYTWKDGFYEPSDPWSNF